MVKINLQKPLLIKFKRNRSVFRTQSNSKYKHSKRRWNQNLKIPNHKLKLTYRNNLILMQWILQQKLKKKKLKTIW